MQRGCGRHKLGTSIGWGGGGGGGYLLAGYVRGIGGACIV